MESIPSQICQQRRVLSPCLPRAKAGVCQDAPSGWALSRDSSYRTPGPLPVLPRERQLWTRLRMLSPAQRAPRDPLPWQQQGWWWLDTSVLHPSAHPKGELWEVGHSLPVPLTVSRNVWWEGVTWPWEVPWMLPDQASILQGPAMVFVPEKAEISKKWISDLFTFYSVLLVSQKAMQDASHSYTHHQIRTAETIEVEVHPTFMNQVLNPHVWIFLYLKLSIVFTGVLR